LLLLCAASQFALRLPGTSLGFSLDARYTQRVTAVHEAFT